jgi:hypothetical protein
VNLTLDCTLLWSIERSEKKIEKQELSASTVTFVGGSL